LSKSTNKGDLFRSLYRGLSVARMILARIDFWEPNCNPRRCCWDSFRATGSRVVPFFVSPNFQPPLDEPDSGLSSPRTRLENIKIRRDIKSTVVDVVGTAFEPRVRELSLFLSVRIFSRTCLSWSYHLFSRPSPVPFQVGRRSFKVGGVILKPYRSSAFVFRSERNRHFYS